MIRVKSLQFIFVRPSRTDGVSGQDSNIQILEPCDMRIDFTEVGPTKPQNNSFHRFKRVLAMCICRTKTFVTFFGLLITSKKQFTRIWPPEMWAIRIQCQPQIGLFTHRKTFFSRRKYHMQNYTLKCTHVCVTVSYDCECIYFSMRNHCSTLSSRMTLWNSSFLL